MASTVSSTISKYRASLEELSSLTLLESTLKTNKALITKLMPSAYANMSDHFVGADIFKNPLYKNMHLNEILQTKFDLVPSADSHTLREVQDHDIDIHDSTMTTNYSTFGRSKVILLDKFTRYRSRLSKYENYFTQQNRISDLCFLNTITPVGVGIRPNTSIFLNIRFGRHSVCQSLSSNTVIIDVGRNSDVTINEDFYSNEDCQLFNIVYVIREGASLKLARNYYKKGFLINESKVIQHPYSDFFFECKTNSNETYVVDAMNIEVWNNCNTNVVSRIDCNSTIFNMATNIMHKSENSISATDVKSVNNNNSKFTFLGNINIDKQGENVSAKLYNKNLVIDKLSTVTTEPKLDINNKNIECAHGCTVSHINEEQLYYLSSRGIELHESKSLISKAFLES